MKLLFKIQDGCFKGEAMPPLIFLKKYVIINYKIKKVIIMIYIDDTFPYENYKGKGQLFKTYTTTEYDGD